MDSKKSDSLIKQAMQGTEKSLFVTQKKKEKTFVNSNVLSQKPMRKKRLELSQD